MMSNSLKKQQAKGKSSIEKPKSNNLFGFNKASTLPKQDVESLSQIKSADESETECMTSIEEPDNVFA